MTKFGVGKNPEFIAVDQFVRSGDVIPFEGKKSIVASKDLVFSQVYAYRRVAPRSLFSSKDYFLVSESVSSPSGSFFGESYSALSLKSPDFFSPKSEFVSSQILDLTVESKFDRSFSNIVSGVGRGVNVLTSESYLRAETIRRGFKLETVGVKLVESSSVDPFTFKSVNRVVEPVLLVNVKSELPRYEFVDYSPKFRDVFAFSNSEFDFGLSVPSRAVVFQDSTFSSKSFFSPGSESVFPSRLGEPLRSRRGFKGFEVNLRENRYVGDNLRVPQEDFFYNVFKIIPKEAYGAKAQIGRASCRERV